MILIVDDKPENLLSLKKLLEINGFEADCAQSGEEALRLILRKSYSLIILDVQMPGMDGFELAETISGYSKSRGIPIIFLSAVNINKQFITKGYASGGMDYITKPFDPDILLLRVSTLHRLYDREKRLQEIQQRLEAEIETRKKAEQALQHANQFLENKINERTAELLTLNRDLEASNAELQQYAYLASHDLQEPLRKIITFTSLLSDKFLRNIPEAEKYMEKIISSSERMRNLINDLLNFSRLSAGEGFVTVSLNEVIQDSIVDLELAIEEKKAKLIINDLPDAEIIPGQMRQVFQNLISNSLKFCKQNVPPVISITGELTQSAGIHGERSEHGEYLRITVKDNGIGFDDKYIDKVFTLFQRLHGRNEFEGTGIGLAIVKKIIEKHNGVLTARSREGEGTEIIMVIPLKQQTKNNLSLSAKTS